MGCFSSELVCFFFVFVFFVAGVEGDVGCSFSPGRLRRGRGLREGDR